ncbi:hypothetical protein M5K25_008253 [Dendrobium thyrsiflorum]|uniref:Cytochrome P450 n=1 Tax=Dendrobium thyrsiflorum TaxID=117978 RepID=A0ABD0VEX5_DENTH
MERKAEAYVGSYEFIKVLRMGEEEGGLGLLLIGRDVGDRKNRDGAWDRNEGRGVGIRARSIEARYWKEDRCRNYNKSSSVEDFASLMPNHYSHEGWKLEGFSRNCVKFFKPTEDSDHDFARGSKAIPTCNSPGPKDLQDYEARRYHLPKRCYTRPFHHDHEIWGEDIHEFNLERFADGICKATKNNQIAFFPFGWGPRICLGQNFAMSEAKMLRRIQ